MMVLNKYKFIIVLLISVGLIIGFGLWQNNDQEMVDQILRQQSSALKFLRFNKDSPILEHERRNYPLSYFPVNLEYRIIARWIPIEKVQPLFIPTSTNETVQYLEKGTITFSIDNQVFDLTVYEDLGNQNSRELLLIFTDQSTGVTTYSGGRYLKLKQIGKNSMLVDFNLAYQPFCAYNKAYSCPIPPTSNHIDIPMHAGQSWKLRD